VLTARLYTGGVQVPGAPVGFYARLRGTTSWTHIGTVTTGATGRAQLRVAPAYDTEYVARDLRAASGTVSPALDSGVRAVLVHRAATLAVSRTTLRSGTRVTFSGAVSPSGRGLTVTLQRAVSGRWVTVTTTTVTRRSTFALTARPPRGRPAYRVVVAADATHLNAVSPSRTLHVT